MRNELTDAQFERLPKYAREHIKELRRWAGRVEDTLEKMQDSQRKTKVWTTEYINNEDIDRYFEADYVNIEHKGVHLRVSGLHDDGRDLQLSWSPAGGGGFNMGCIGLIPTATQQAKLVNLAYDKIEMNRLIRLKQFNEAQKGE